MTDRSARITAMDEKWLALKRSYETGVKDIKEVTVVCGLPYVGVLAYYTTRELMEIEL